MRKIAYVKCEPSEKNFAKLFNFFDGYIEGKMVTPSDKSFEFRCVNMDDRFLENDRDVINALKKGSYSTCQESPSFDNLQVIVDIIVPSDNVVDSFFFRYLIVLKNKLLRFQDVIVISCDQVFYHKISSLFYFESFDDDKTAKLYAYDENSELKIKKFSHKFFPSSEWLPIMSFDKNDVGSLYEVLSSPIGEKEEIIRIYQEYKEDQCNVKKMIERIPRIKQKESYRSFFISCLFYWMDSLNEETIFYIYKYLNTFSTLSLLIFTMELKFRFKCSTDTASNLNLTNVNRKKLFNTSLDFAEGILQIIENMVGHSKGGAFLFRINQNMDKIEDEIIYKTGIKSVGYMRISVVDYSKEGIVDRIKRKNDIGESLSLEEVFCFQKIQNPTYKNYLMREDSTVHHYGLSIFNTVVLQHGGCFVVKSKGSVHINSNLDFYYSENSKGFKLKNPDDIVRNHISGTEYNITLPVLDFKNTDFEGMTSVFVDHEYDKTTLEKKPLFERPIWDFFNSEVSKIVRDNTKKMIGKSIQERKEATVNDSADVLSNEISKYDTDKCVFYFYIDNDHMPFRRTEIIAKILMKTFLILNKENKSVSAVIFGISDTGIEKFVRQFALFYRNGICEYMEKNQLYVVSNTYESEVLLYGKNLNSSFSHLCSKEFKYGVSSEFSDTLKYILSNCSEDPTVGTADMLPLDFDLLRRIEIVGNQPQLSVNNKRWFFYKLETVINNDIHNHFFGCKIKNIHVRVNNVHIDTFYECQLLFGNPFWCRMFSNYIAECILQDPQIDKKKPIILYGYETYSEQLLLFIKKVLSSVIKDVRIEYIIYENGKYITSNEKSQSDVRYFDRIAERLGGDIVTANYVFINGISTTLSTFKYQLYKQLENKIKSMGFSISEFNKTHKVAFVIVQVVDQCESSVANDYIETASANDIHGTNYVYSKKGYLDYIYGERCSYLISANSKWYRPENCDLCTPLDLKDEKFLVETNDASTVPMILIKPSHFYTSVAGGIIGKTSFLDDIGNQKYLYYGHLNRGENHYRFYIRTARYVQDNLGDASELRKWFNSIKTNESIVESGDKNTINIIISPTHYSNAALVASVNEYVFNNQAHVITINTKKEFRDSFEAKFNNYKTMIELLKNEMPNVRFTINFYYVDDQLVTGSHYYRAKSLIMGLIGDNNNSDELRINIFKAAIILINRNSYKTINNLNVPVFYSFINLNTPSIRSYGDSCPMCQEVMRINHIVEEASLFSTEQYWRDKLDCYCVHSLHQAKEETRNVDVYGIVKKEKYKGFRRLQCSEEIWKALKHQYAETTAIKNALEQCVDNYLFKYLSVERIKLFDKKIMGNSKRLCDRGMVCDYRIEYLISFLKVASRPPIIYQENVNTAILQMLLEIYTLFFNSPPSSCLYENTLQLIQNCSNSLKYDLYRVVISCLCSIGSNLFYRESGEELIKCFDKGMELEYDARKDSITNREPFDDFLRCQLKRDMFSNKDSASKVRTLESILLLKIKEEKDGI